MATTRRRRKSNNRAGMICISAIVVVFVTVMSVQIVRLYQKDQEYIEKEAKVAEELQEQTDRQEELKQYEAYTNSPQHVEDVAKTKLGLLHDNQIVFKEEK